MVQTLADFLRGTVSGGESTVRTIREELKHLNLYLEIEMIRFEDRLSVNYSIDENTYEKEIPALILQPLVENAIKHGLYDTIGKITITIDAKLSDNFIVIKISNPYETEQGSTKAGTGFGLSSVSRRMQLIYLRNDLLMINSENQLFTVTLKIPSQ
jgi:LytS/YehU family sensor histidine kinase